MCKWYSTIFGNILLVRYLTSFGTLLKSLSKPCGRYFGGMSTSWRVEQHARPMGFSLGHWVYFGVFQHDLTYSRIHRIVLAFEGHRDFVGFEPSLRMDGLKWPDMNLLETPFVFPDWLCLKKQKGVSKTR